MGGWHLFTFPCHADTFTRIPVIASRYTLHNPSNCRPDNNLALITYLFVASSFHGSGCQKMIQKFSLDNLAFRVSREQPRPSTRWFLTKFYLNIYETSNLTVITVIFPARYVQSVSEIRVYTSEDKFTDRNWVKIFVRFMSNLLYFFNYGRLKKKIVRSIRRVHRRT